MDKLIQKYNDLLEMVKSYTALLDGGTDIMEIEGLKGADADSRLEEIKSLQSEMTSLKNSIEIMKGVEGFEPFAIPEPKDNPVEDNGDAEMYKKALDDILKHYARPKEKVSGNSVELAKMFNESGMADSISSQQSFSKTFEMEWDMVKGTLTSSGTYSDDLPASGAIVEPAEILDMVYFYPTNGNSVASRVVDVDDPSGTDRDAVNEGTATNSPTTHAIKDFTKSWPVALSEVEDAGDNFMMVLEEQVRRHWRKMLAYQIMEGDNTGNNTQGFGNALTGSNSLAVAASTKILSGANGMNKVVSAVRGSGGNANIVALDAGAAELAYSSQQN